MSTSTPNIDLVPKEALEQLKELDKQLDTTTKGMKDMLTQVQGISNSLSSSAKNYQELVDAVKALNAAGTTYAGTTRRQKTLMEQIAAAEKRLIELETKEAKELAKLKVQIQEQNKANKDAAKAVLAHANSLDAMRAKLSQMKAEAGNLDVLSDEYKKLTADIAKLNAEVSKHEQSMGVYGRNVGNYTSAFSNLQYQIQQVARELPSLTIGASQFFLAISNNLPMLVDELKRVRMANKEAVQNGEKAVPVITQLIKGVLNWQTALVVGITLLSTYGKEIGAWVRGLFNAKEATDDIITVQMKLNKAYVDGAKNAAKEQAELKLLYSTATDANKPLEDRNRAVEILQKRYPEYLNNLSKEEIMVGKGAVAYANISANIKQAARNQAVFNLMVEEMENRLADEELLKQLKKTREDVLRDNISISDIKDLGFIVDDEEIESFEDLSEAIQFIENKLQESNKQLDLLKSNIEVTELPQMKKEDEKEKKKVGKNDALKSIIKQMEAENDLEQLRLYNSAEINKRIITDQSKSYEDRVNAVEAYTMDLENALYNQFKTESEILSKQGGTRAEQTLLLEKYYAELERLGREKSELLQGIEEQRVNGIIKQIQREAAARSMNTDLEERAAYKVLASKGIKDSEKYEEEKNKIAREYALKRFKNEEAALKEILNLENLSNEDRAKIEQQLEKATFDYKMYLLNEEIKEEDRKNKKSLELEKLKADKRKELLQSVYDFANTLIMARFENQLKALDEESEANQEWADEEMERIERLEESGAISKEQAEARKEAIDDQAQAREEQIEAKKREVLRKQAIYEKAQTIAGIAWNTALAIMKMWATLGPEAPAYVAIAAAAGALQTATVLATPIPEYAEGTDDHPGGLAIVGDGGKSEMVISGGKIYKTPAVDTLIDLPRHAVVLPDFSKAMEKLPEKPNNHSVIKIDNTKLETYSMENNKLLKMLIVRMERDARNAVYDRELSRLRPTKR